MTQRKLTDAELQNVMLARHCLRNVLEFSKHVHYIGVALQQLDAIAIHCTTDGKPWIEPQPEIGEGYRLATEADKDRRDLEFWSKAGGGWQHRKSFHGTPLDPDYHYRVPVDRIPTDEDAKQRPTVMVRNNERMKWKVVKLVMVAEKAEGIHFPFVTIDSLRPDCWACCRFPYPGELD